MKSYTDIEQSKILEKILLLESADMTYSAITEGMREKMTIQDWKVNVGLDVSIKENLFSYRNGYMIPCWSLAALLNVLPHIQEFYPTLEKINDKYVCRYKSSGIWTNGANPVDACYEMILKLHEQNIL